MEDLFTLVLGAGPTLDIGLCVLKYSTMMLKYQNVSFLFCLSQSSGELTQPDNHVVTGFGRFCLPPCDQVYREGMTTPII